MARTFSPDDLPLPRSKTAAILIGALMIALIGRLDYATGAETTVIILYLLPIALIAWVAGAAWATVAALGSAILSLLGDMLVISTFRNPLVPYWNSAVQFCIFALFGLALAALRASMKREHVASRVDYVTGLANWRAFAEAAEAELARVRRYGRSLTLVYMDCDNFKHVNDTLGHAEGDHVLRLVAEALCETTRVVDTVARLGGDEFVVLLPETGPESAETAVARMRSSLENVMARAKTEVTVSMGTATFREPPKSLDELVRAADKLLYEAKAEGGDRSVHATFGECA
jgi:diguanylate cyclase (GGDEF)-like protein